MYRRTRGKRPDSRTNAEAATKSSPASSSTPGAREPSPQARRDAPTGAPALSEQQQSRLALLVEGSSSRSQSGACVVRRRSLACSRTRGLRSLTQAAAIGVVWETSWPCGQSAQPKSECHRRRYTRHKARDLGPLGFDCGAGDVPLQTVASSKIGLDAPDLARPSPPQKGNSYGPASSRPRTPTRRSARATPRERCATSTTQSSGQSAVTTL